METLISVVLHPKVNQIHFDILFAFYSENLWRYDGLILSYEEQDSEIMSKICK